MPRNQSVEFIEDIRQFIPAPPFSPSPAVQTGSRVGLLSSDTDHTCAVLGALALTNNAIKRHTGLSDAQIYYRLKKARVSRLSIRRGESPYSKILIAACGRKVASELRQNLAQASEE